MQHLAESGIPSMIYYPLPLQEQEAFKGIARAGGELKTAKVLAESVLSLPMHTELSQEMQDWVIDGIRTFIKKQ